MSKKRYERILDPLRGMIAAEKQKGFYPMLRIREAAEKLKVHQHVLDQACNVLLKEGLLTHRSMGVYYIKAPPPPSPPPSACRLLPPWQPRKQKVSWGSKARILPIIRKKKPWVVEKWYEVDQRWFMYMEAGCDRDPSHQTPAGCTDMKEVAPEDQPILPRRVIERWHFDLEGALNACAIVRRRHRKETFRTRDTSKGDYLMGAIL